MSNRSSLASLSAIYILLAGCASIGSQPAYVEDSKPKAQGSCQSQAAGAPGATDKDHCKK